MIACPIRLLLPVLLASGLLSVQAMAGADPAAATLMKDVEARPEGSSVRADLRFALTDARGRTQERRAVALRRVDDRQQRQAIYLTEPRALKGTVLLSWRGIGTSTQASDQWLYLPTLQRSRRIPATERSQPFLGTELSYADMEAVAKVSTRDWQFEALSAIPGRAGHFRVEGRPASDDIARQLGYGRGSWVVDKARRIVVEAELADRDGKPLKRIVFDELTEIDGAWTPQRVRVDNLQNRQSTELRFAAIEPSATFDAALLTESGMARGP